MHEAIRIQCQSALRHFGYRDTQTHDRNYRLCPNISARILWIRSLLGPKCPIPVVLIRTRSVKWPTCGRGGDRGAVAATADFPALGRFLSGVDAKVVVVFVCGGCGDAEWCGTSLRCLRRVFRSRWWPCRCLCSSSRCGTGNCHRPAPFPCGSRPHWWQGACRRPRATSNRCSAPHAPPPPR